MPHLSSTINTHRTRHYRRDWMVEHDVSYLSHQMYVRMHVNCFIHEYLRVLVSHLITKEVIKGWKYYPKHSKSLHS